MKKVYVINIFINQYIFVTFDRIGSWFSKRGKIHQKEGKYTKKRENTPKRGKYLYQNGGKYANWP
jgi:hypothetical protein